MADKLTLDRKAMKDRSTAHLRIYVGNLPDHAVVDELYEHFIPYGQINGLIVNKNFAFVQFEEESSAQASITKANGSSFKGKSIIVRSVQTTNEKRKETEVVTIQPELPPALALSDNIPVVEDEAGEDLYDNYGNFVGEPPNYRDEEHEEPQNWENNDAGRGGPRGRGPRGAMRGRGGRGRPKPSFNERAPPGPGRGGEWPERGYDRFQQPVNNYPPRPLPVTERNDCEIIVVSKGLTEYAEYIENRLKRLGIVVDLLFPMEDVPIGKVLGNIASRGCLYAILVMPQNQEHRSLSLTILHGLPQEHRNMPLEDALQLLSRNFQEVQRGGTSGREAVYALLGQLADGRTLTVLQYDKVIEYLQERREQQVKIELGEPMPSATTNKAQAELQQRILSILNNKKVDAKSEAVTPSPQNPIRAQSPNKLLNDPTVKKALDSILQKFI